MTTADLDHATLAALLGEAVGLDLADFEAVRPLLDRPLGRLPRPCVALDYLADAGAAAFTDRYSGFATPPDAAELSRQWEAILSDDRAYIWADPDTWSICLMADDRDIGSDGWMPPIGYNRWDFALCPLPLPPAREGEPAMPEAQVRAAAEMAGRYGHLWAPRFCGWRGGPVAPSQIDAVTGVCDYPRHIAGIDSPYVWEGRAAHTTATGRLTWSIGAEAEDAWLEVNRPAGTVLSFEIGRSESGRWHAYWERHSPEVPTFDRHTDEAREAATNLLMSLRAAHPGVPQELWDVAATPPEANHLPFPESEAPEPGRAGFWYSHAGYGCDYSITDGFDTVAGRIRSENEEAWCRAWAAVRAGMSLADAVRKFKLEVRE